MFVSIYLESFYLCIYLSWKFLRISDGKLEFNYCHSPVSCLFFTGVGVEPPKKPETKEHQPKDMYIHLTGFTKTTGFQILYIVSWFQLCKARIGACLQ